VYTDDHRGRHVGRLEVPAPLRDPLTVTGEHDCLGRIRRDVHRDLPPTVVLERLGDKLSCYRVSTRRFRQCFGTARTGRLFWSSFVGLRFLESRPSRSLVALSISVSRTTLQGCYLVDRLVALRKLPVRLVQPQVRCRPGRHSPRSGRPARNWGAQRHGPACEPARSPLVKRPPLADRQRPGPGPPCVRSPGRGS